MKTGNSVFLHLSGIVKEFSGVRVLHGVDLELKNGEVMALMGENGAGKSTLMKILSGVYTDWQGKINLDGKNTHFQNTRDAENAGIAIIYQELNLVPGLSVAENIFLGREPSRFAGIVDFKQLRKMAQEILAELNIQDYVTTPVSQLRVGHQQLVEIAKALSLNARILIMDEPTSALSESETELLFSVIRKLKKRGVSIIYISHRMAEIFEIADRITVLRDGKTVGVENAGDISRQQLIKMMVGQDINQFFVKKEKPGHELVLKVNNLVRCNPDPSKRPLVDNVSFQVKKGEVFGIAGLLGAGRTELCESLFGAAYYDTTGTIEIDGKTVGIPSPEHAIKAGIALITEDRKGNGLVLGMDVKQNMTLAALDEIVRYRFILSDTKEKDFTLQNIKQLSVQANNLDNPVETLSGGNQQKVLLAKWLATRPKILILDDPTRGIDVGAKHEIYLLLTELVRQGLTIIMTSSELQELIMVCDRIMVLREGSVSVVFDREEATQEKILDAAAPIS